MNRIPRSRIAEFLCVAMAGVATDLASKDAVFETLGYPEKSSDLLLQGWVSFRLFTSFNRGALWGFGQGFSWLFAALSVLASAGIVYWLFFRGAARSRWLTWCLALIMAGTLGNLYDRLGLHGCTEASGAPIYAVRDFLLFTFGSYHYPVFNFADVCLVTGAIMLVLQSFSRDGRQAVTAAHDSPAASPEKPPADLATLTARR